MAKQRGRPSKLKQPITYRDGEREIEITVEEAILRALRVGVPQRYAAQAAGVDEHTLSTWIVRGSEWGDEPEKAPAGRERDYALFAHEVVRARASAVAYNVGILRRAAAEGQWRAALAWLRSQVPEFREKLDVEHGGEITLETSDRVKRGIARILDELADGRPT